MSLKILRDTVGLIEQRIGTERAIGSDMLKAVHDELDAIDGLANVVKDRVANFRQAFMGYMADHDASMATLVDDTKPEEKAA